MSIEPNYYNVGLDVFKCPINTKQEDGTSSTSLGFIVCTASEIIGEDGAKLIAETLSQAEAPKEEPTPNNLYDYSAGLCE